MKLGWLCKGSKGYNTKEVNGALMMPFLFGEGCGKGGGGLSYLSGAIFQKKVCLTLD